MKKRTFENGSGKQEKLANAENAPQVRGKNINDTHNSIKEALGPNIKR